MSVTVPRKKVDEFADALFFLSNLFKDETAAQLSRVDFSRPVAEVSDELVEVVCPICEAGARTSSAVAARFYEEVRAISLGTAPAEPEAVAPREPEGGERRVPAPAEVGSSPQPAQQASQQPSQPSAQQASKTAPEPAPPRIVAPLSKEPPKQPDGFKAIAGSIGYDAKATEAFVRDSAKRIEVEGEKGVERVKTEMASRVGYQVKRSAGETVMANGARDSHSVRFARVPRPTRSYEDGCLFCQMLASRGFVYHTAGLAGEISHYHDGCACMVVPGFGDNPTVEGYDPKRYKAGSREWQMRDHSMAQANRRERELMRGAGTGRRRRR